MLFPTRKYRIQTSAKFRAENIYADTMFKSLSVFARLNSDSSEAIVRAGKLVQTLLYSSRHKVRMSWTWVIRESRKQNK